ncbi:MAG: RNA-binding protein [Desulfuromonadales bacterium]|nr:RNA-binding protein [Desulfuromonadales bacterium]
MSRELYIGSLPYEATEDDLRRFFSVAGSVQSVHLITDSVSGKSKGCGYVKMTTESEAKDAIEALDGALMMNRLISVSIARQIKKQEISAKLFKRKKTVQNF